MVSVGLRNFFGNVLDWVYPPKCVHCGEPGALICDTCLSSLEPVGAHFCSVCGKPLKKGQRCPLCRKSSFSFQSSRAPYLYEGAAADMIKRLKYGGCMSLIPIMSEKLTSFWYMLNWQTDLLIPVPLSARRRAGRGFNQSELLGRALSKSTGIPMKSTALVKIRDTRQQAILSAEKRRENLHGAFAAERVMVNGKRILLLDDVMTTGSTFTECSAVLLDAGAISVKCLSFATAAIGHGNHNMLNAQTRTNL